MIIEMIEENDFLKVDKETVEYSWYESSKSEIADVLAGKTYTSIETFNESFEAACYLHKLSCSHILNLESMLRDYNGNYTENGAAVLQDFEKFDEELTDKEKKNYTLELLSGELYESVLAIA